MANEFARVLTLLRKERGLSQKQAAADLGVAQALLSHYEKGKRECGLDFLIKAADYYGVTTDYLLGRSPVNQVTVITEKDVPDSPPTQKAHNLGADAASAVFAKKLTTNSIEVVFDLAGKARNPKVLNNIFNLFSTAVYRAFRLVYKCNPENNSGLFSIPEPRAFHIIPAVEAVYTADALEAAKDSGDGTSPLITRGVLEESYGQQASILLNTVMNCENQLKKLDI